MRFCYPNSSVMFVKPGDSTVSLLSSGEWSLSPFSQFSKILKDVRSLRVSIFPKYLNVFSHWIKEKGNFIKRILRNDVYLCRSLNDKIEEQFPTSQKVYKKYSQNTENSPIVTTALAFFLLLYLHNTVPLKVVGYHPLTQSCIYWGGSSTFQYASKQEKKDWKSL